MSTISFEKKDDLLILKAVGRIDTSNADAVEKSITEICSANPSENVVLDAEELEYISSAGLRVVLRLRKASPSLKIINAQSEVYDIFEMTGFSEMIPIEKAYRKFSVDGCSVIGEGAKGTVYRYNDDTIVKVYKKDDCLPDIQRERELARKAFVLGIPTAISYDIVKVGTHFGSVFELLDASSFSQLIVEHPEKMDEYIGEFAAMLRQIHSTKVSKDDMPNGKNIVAKWLKDLKGQISDDSLNKLEKLLGDLPDRLTMLHCDYHTNNIMMQKNEALMIDMDTLSYGNPVIELANVHCTYEGFADIDPEDVEHFLGMPQEVYRQIWNKFLPAYLETNDEKVIDETSKKVLLLSYTRVLRHSIRHQKDPERLKKAFELCTSIIDTLVNEVSTLEL